MKFTATDIKACINGDVLNIDVSLIADPDIKMIRVPITITRSNKMEYQKDYSLLRPFDLESAKIGDRLCLTCDAKFDDSERKYIAGPDSNGRICVQYKDGSFDVFRQSNYSMLPLAWVEGKPVYKGDVLYYDGKATEILGRCNQEDSSLGVLFQCASHGSMWSNLFTWQKPKTKREGWVNVYPYNNTSLFNDEEMANRHATSMRIACVRIEWEE